MRTCTVLEERWSLPDDFRRLIEAVYGDIDLDSLDAEQGELHSAEGEMNEQIDKTETRGQEVPDSASESYFIQSGRGRSKKSTTKKAIQV